MIEIQKVDKKLILKYDYSDLQSNYWVDDKLLSNKSFLIKKVFNVRKEILIKRVEEDFEEPEYYFEIGFLVGECFKIDKTVFGLKNDFYFHKDLPLSEKHFIAKPKSHF